MDRCIRFVCRFLSGCFLWVGLFSGRCWSQDAEGLFKSGQFAEARTAFVAILAENSSDPVALFYMGHLTREGAKSRGFFQRVVSEFPTHELADDALFELAEADFAQGLYMTARGGYRRLLEKYPETNCGDMAYYRIGMSFLAVNQLDSAMVAFEKPKARPERDYAKLGRLETLVRMGRAAEARGEAGAWLHEGAGEFEPEVQGYLTRTTPDVGPVATSKQVDGVFWIQVAAYRTLEGGQSVKAQLESEGFSAELGTRAGSGLVILFAGPYASRGAASNASRRIDQLVHVRSKVTER
jgi:TolA-binding protein